MSEDPVEYNRDYSWITTDQYYEELENLAYSYGVKFILNVPGVKELLAEELNNEILDALYDRRQEKVRYLITYFLDSLHDVSLAGDDPVLGSNQELVEELTKEQQKFYDNKMQEQVSL
jgi:hypothetical protein